MKKGKNLGQGSRRVPAGNTELHDLLSNVNEKVFSFQLF
jgi:hypothetical protein